MTVTGVDNSPPMVDGNQVSLVTVAVNDGSSGDAWNPLGDQLVTVTNQDDD